MVSSDFADITTSSPERKLVKGKKSNAGRNSAGRITVRHRGGGHKRRYRLIDFNRDKHMEATVLTVEYDPNRTARICLVEYTDGEKRYIVAPEGLKPGMKIHSGKEAAPNVGHAMYLSDIPLGTVKTRIRLGMQKLRSAWKNDEPINPKKPI